MPSPSIFDQPPAEPPPYIVQPPSASRVGDVDVGDDAHDPRLDWCSHWCILCDLYLELLVAHHSHRPIFDCLEVQEVRWVRRAH